MASGRVEAQPTHPNPVKFGEGLPSPYPRKALARPFVHPLYGRPPHPRQGQHKKHYKFLSIHDTTVGGRDSDPQGRLHSAQGRPGYAQGPPGTPQGGKIRRCLRFEDLGCQGDCFKFLRMLKRRIGPVKTTLNIASVDTLKGCNISRKSTMRQ